MLTTTSFTEQKEQKEHKGPVNAYHGWDIYAYEQQICSGLVDFCSQRPVVYAHLSSNTPSSALTEDQLRALLNDIAAEFESYPMFPSHLYLPFLVNVWNKFNESPQKAQGLLIDPKLPSQFPINVLQLLVVLWGFAVLTKNREYRPRIDDVCARGRSGCKRTPKNTASLPWTVTPATTAPSTPTLQPVTTTAAPSATAPTLHWLHSLPLLTPIPTPGSILAGSAVQTLEVKGEIISIDIPLFQQLSLDSTPSTPFVHERKRSPLTPPSELVSTEGPPIQGPNTRKDKPYIMFIVELMSDIGSLCLKGVSNRLWLDFLSIQDHIEF